MESRSTRFGLDLKNVGHKNTEWHWKLLFEVTRSKTTSVIDKLWPVLFIWSYQKYKETISHVLNICNYLGNGEEGNATESKLNIGSWIMENQYFCESNVTIPCSNIIPFIFLFNDTLWCWMYEKTIIFVNFLFRGND